MFGYLERYGAINKGSWYTLPGNTLDKRRQ